MSDAVVFDCDGTLYDVSGIRHYLTDDARRKNFEKFHAASSYVQPHAPVADLARTLHQHGLTIMVVTARMERWRYTTSTWLRKWGIEHQGLYMRPDEDGRKDVEIKREILARIRAEGHRVVLAVDDNPAIVALWNEERIPVVTWPGWEVDQ